MLSQKIHTQKKLSIITNFKECSLNCPYCVWKRSENAEKYSDDIWTKKYVKSKLFKNFLFTHFESFRDLNDVYSISGGSDPLIDIKSGASKYFYKLLHKVNKKFKMKYQIHTALKNQLYNLPKYMYEDLDKVALHIMENDSIEEICNINQFLSEKNIKIRVALVVTPSLQKEYCKELEEVLDMKSIPLSYREMWPICTRSDIKWFEAANYRHHLNHFIKQQDYNIYVMPDLNISASFIQGV